MSFRAVAVCAVIICVAGCNDKDSLNTNAVQQHSVWQRRAGQSPQEAAQIARQMDVNTETLKKAIQSGKAEELTPMQGRLVALSGKVEQQSDSSWTMKNDDGWTIVAKVSDTTPNSDMTKDRIASCGAQGIIQTIDLAAKQIVLADVELSPVALPAMAGKMATK